MSSPLEVGPVLAAELRSLNRDQLRAVLHEDDSVVRAGPGSGKTRTLVAKVAYLLDSQVSPQRGVAAITYTRQAAREIVTRLDRLGLRPGRQLACTTVHGWCLSAILRPYGPLAGIAAPGNGKVIDDDSTQWDDVLQDCFDQVGLSNQARYERATITKLRREIAAGMVDADDETPMVRAARLFDERLLALGQWDFDAIVARSLRIVREQPIVGELLAARFPWLVVDEYQDLGPVLHELVLQLHDAAGITVSAFGDPDQSLMGFTGADPRYLNALAARPTFEDLSLELNYRCGQAIVAASHAALGEERSYRALPDRTDEGLIDLVPVNGGLDVHAMVTCTRIKDLMAAGAAGHDIVVLYPAKGPLLSALTNKFDLDGIPYVHERDERLPTGDLADFIRDCAARAVAGYQPVGLSGSDRQTVATLGELSYQYVQLRQSSGLRPLPGRAADRRLASALDGFDAEAQTPLETWLVDLDQALDLDAVAAGSPAVRDQRAVGGFATAARKHALAVQDIAAGTLRAGKVTLTTYHSAKGREWDAVFLPGLVDGIMPGRRWSPRLQRYPEPPPDQLQQARRSFYVGLTRAKKSLTLIYGTYWETDWRQKNNYGVSRFVKDVLAYLDSK